MKYMLLIYLDENALNDAERQQCYEDSAALARDLHAQGSYVAASPLQPVSTARSVRIREEKRLITDGPFAETREQLGGYFMVEAPDLEAAVKIAERIPGARTGTVEVRPIIEVPGLPEI